MGKVSVGLLLLLLSAGVLIVPEAYGQMTDSTSSSSEIVWSSGHYFPKFPRVSTAYVYEWNGNAAEALTLLSLQGIVNREDPQVYLILDKYSDAWLKYAQSKISLSVQTVSSSHDLITRYRSFIKGIVVYDPSVPDTINVATTISGLDSRLISDPTSLPALQQLLGITDILDLRQNVNKFGWSNTPSGRLAIYQWVYDNLWPKCERRMIGVANPGSPVSTSPITLGIRDYIVALELVTLYLSPNDPDQKALYQKFLSTAPSPIPVFGWTENEEEETVSLVSSYGDWVPVLAHIYQSNYPSDLTILSGIDVTPVRYVPKIDQDIVLRTAREPGLYVTAYVTDGDNLGYDYSLGWDNWNRYQSSSEPLGWTINPTLIDLAPLIWNYYMSSASTQVTFIAGPSGAGFMHPQDMTAIQVSNYLSYARSYWAATGLQTTQALGWSNGYAQTYSAGLSPLGIFTGYYGSLDRGMVPFSIGSSPSEILFHFENGAPFPIAPNSYSISDPSYKLGWSEGEILNNLLALANGRASTGNVSYPAVDLNGWGQSISDPTSVAKSVRVAPASQSSQTRFVFGPYATLPPGRYEVRFRLKIGSLQHSGSIATIDVATDIGERVLTQRQVSTSDFTPDTWTEFKLEFQLNRATDNMEFRVRFYPAYADLYADTIQLTKIDGWTLPDPHIPIFIAISVIAYARTPDAVEAFLTKIANLDPRIHLVNTDEFFAAINPEFMLDLSGQVLGKADRALIQPSVEADKRRAEDLFSNGHYGESLSVTRSIIRETTAALTVTTSPADAVTLSPDVGVHIYSLGTTVTANETEKEGYSFLGWTLDGKATGASESTVVKMDSDHNLTAVFQIEPKSSPIGSNMAYALAAVGVVTLVTVSVIVSVRRRRARQG